MDFLFGCVGGFVGQFLCYPLDTAKSRYQKLGANYSPWKDYQGGGLKSFYRGLASPLTSVILEKSVLFGSYSYFRQFGYGSLLEGLLAGLISTFIVVPFERVKVCVQIRNQSSLINLKRILREDGLRSLYRGWTATLFREVPGYGIYFSTYQAYRNYRGRSYLNPGESFLIGSLSGICAWILIYPSDPIKTLMQADNLRFSTAMKQIYSERGLGGFYSGYSWGLGRAAILHGGVFLGYESSRKLYT